jgi:MoxR-like ATPase
MPIKKHRRRLANGEEKVYTYSVSADGTQRRSLSIRHSSVSLPVYRSKEKKRIVATLLANSSLLVVSEPGAGKSFLAEAVKEELDAQSFMGSNAKK